MERLNKLRRWMFGYPLVVALLFAPFFKPYGFIATHLVADWIFVIWKCAVLLLAGIMFISQPKVSPITILMGAYQLILLVSTAADHGELMDWAYDAGSTAAFFVLVELGAGTNAKNLLKGMACSLGVVCLINLATVLAFKGGLYWDAVYFLGTDNAHALYILPLLGLSMIWADRAVKRPLPLQIALLAVFSASLYITWSVTAVLSASAFLVLVLLYRVKGSGRVLNIGVYYGLIVAAFLLVAIFRVQNYFAFFIEGVLHKDVTLTDRIPLWDTVLGWVRERPLLGYGLLTKDVMGQMLDARWHCHNLFLQTLFETGALGLAVYLAMLGCAVRPLMKRRDHPVGYYMAATIFVLLLDMLAESPIFPLPFYGILLLAWHMEDVVASLEA